MEFTSLGIYEILEVLGEGGMGTVYKARDPRFDRTVAIKILHAQYRRDPAVADRFKAEAVIQAKLNHPGIVGVHDFYATDEVLAIVMEFFEGENLEDLLRTRSRLSRDESISIFEQVLAAIGHAHDAGLVHRDIKPSNVLVRQENGRWIVKVMDFGIAKILGSNKLQTQTAAKMGTLAYMSPEHVSSPKGVDRRSDIYSLGATLFEMISGKLPFDGETEFDIMRAILEEPPRRFESDVVDPLLRDVIFKSLAKNPDDRFESCHEFIEALRGASFVPVEKSQLEAPRPTVQVEVPVQVPPSRTYRVVLISALAAVVLGSIGGFSYVRSLRQAAQLEAEEARAAAERLVEQQKAAAADEKARIAREYEQQREREQEEQREKDRAAAERRAQYQKEQQAKKEQDQARRRAELETQRQVLRAAIATAESRAAAGREREARESLTAARNEVPVDSRSDLADVLAELDAAVMNIDRALIVREASEQRLETARKLIEEGNYPEAKVVCDTLIEDQSAPRDIRDEAKTLRARAATALEDAWGGATVGPSVKRKKKGTG